MLVFVLFYSHKRAAAKKDLYAERGRELLNPIRGNQTDIKTLEGKNESSNTQATAIKDNVA